MKRVLVAIGTRPEAIKLCPVIKELQGRDNDFDVRVCSTGQHGAILSNALRTFGVVPDHELNVMRSNQGLSELTAALLCALAPILKAERPDLVLVQGDTATAHAATLAAFYEGISVAHVEAGLRTHRMRDPFPEEYHRRAIALLSNFHFAPTVEARRNLMREGIHESTIAITGNTVVDALRYTLTSCRPTVGWQPPPHQRLVVFTAHRRESLGEPLVGMLRALRRLVEAYPDVVAVFPLHPNQAVRRAAFAVLSGTSQIRMIEPPDFVDFHHLLSNAYLIMTDSGGVQEEATALGIPTVVMRYASERTEGVRAGVLRLAGSGEDGIYSLTHRLLRVGSEEYATMRRPSAVFGDGHAAKRIVDRIATLLGA